jgi:hypothetical protein
MPSNAPAGDRIVVQLPLSDSTDFDALIGIENGLIELFKGDARVHVDSHDIGRGKFNVFIRSDEPWPSIFGRIRAFLEFREALENAVVATRPVDGNEYQVLWPPDYGHAFEE